MISLRRITRAIDLHSKQLVRTAGLTVPQLVLLEALRDRGQAKPSQLAKDIHLAQATITSITDRLVRAGYVVRVPSEHDRRSVEIALTKAGRKKLETAPELLQSGFLRELRKLDDWERTQLISSLQRIASMMDAQDIEASPILQAGDISGA